LIKKANDLKNDHTTVENDGPAIKEQYQEQLYESSTGDLIRLNMEKIKQEQRVLMKCQETDTIQNTDANDTENAVKTQEDASVSAPTKTDSETKNMPVWNKLDTDQAPEGYNWRKYSHSTLISVKLRNLLFWSKFETF